MAALPQADVPAAAARYAGIPRLDPASAGSLLTNEPDGDIRKQVRWTLHPVLFMQSPFSILKALYLSRMQAVSSCCVSDPRP